MKRYRWSPDRGTMIDADGFPMLNQEERARPIVAPMVMRDIPEYRSPIDGKPITSRSERREDLKRNDCVEVDPPKRPRGFKNPRFAKKHGLPLY